jgi:hypothetical protein
MERNPSHNDPQDRQLKRLAGQIRDTGTEPERDLWPDINAIIDSEEPRAGLMAPGRKRLPWLRLAAMAAALTLMVTAGWLGIGSYTGDNFTRQAGSADLAGDPETPASGMAVIDKALDELTLALADDPENRNLSHLVLMVHKTRGNLLRRNSENLVRD